ncbi:MAG: ArnT family glycosyltransferase [Limisphaerales bacterium]
MPLLIPAVFSEFKSIIQKQSWITWAGIAGLAIFFLALRWNSFNAPLNRDEGEYAYAAQLLLQGIPPYEQAFIQKPPMIFYSYLLAKLLCPGFFWSARLLAYLFTALATILFGYVVRRELGKGWALPAMWLMTPLILLPDLEVTDANTETFMLLPLIGTIAVYSRSREVGNKGGHWLLAGFLAATALLYKYTCLPVLAFVFAVWLAEAWRSGGGLKMVCRGLALATAGGVAAAALELGYFIRHDGGRGFWECTVTFNRYYAASNIFGLNNFLTEMGMFWKSWWILFLLPWAVLFRLPPRLWFWLGIFVCAVISTGASGYGHYYIIIMPFLALLNIAGIRALASHLSERSNQTLWRASMTAVVMALVVGPVLPWLLCSPEQFVQASWPQQPFAESGLVAEKVAQLTGPDDFVYVAGSEPQILFYAQRYSPTRFIHACALTVPSPVVHEYQQAAMRDLQQRPPKIIVFVQSPLSWLREPATPGEFFDFLNSYLKNYNLLGGFVKPAGQTGHWSDHLNPAEFQSSSLLLYERKSHG